MIQKILSLKEILLTSFWFIPCILMSLWILFWILNIYAESFITIPSGIPVLELFEWWEKDFSDSLSTISSSMISIAGLVFSMTLVALTLVWWQYGSRIIRNFMKSRLTQYVLWSYLATFIYSMIVLRAIKSERFNDITPDISIIFVFILTIANLILLIFFIHHISKIIQVENMIHDIFSELKDNINRLLSSDKDSDTEKNRSKNIQDFEKKLSKYKHITHLKSDRDWYIASINTDGILKDACIDNYMLQFEKCSWDYLMQGSCLGKIYTQKKIDDSIPKSILKHINFSVERKPLDDIRFSIKQMVEIWVRALSPGINDPYTAITCLNNLSSSVIIIAKKDFPKDILHDGDKKPRIRICNIDFDELVDLTFTQIHHYWKESPFVLRRITELFEEILSHDLSPERKKIIKKYQKKLT